MENNIVYCNAYNRLWYELHKRTVFDNKGAHIIKSLKAVTRRCQYEGIV
jgi:hypothetical protein